MREDRLTPVILRHPVLAVGVVTFSTFLLFATLTEQLVEYGAAAGWQTVLTIVLIGYGAAAAFAWPRIVKAAPEEVLFVSWAFAVSCALLAYASALLFGIDRWVLGVGLVTSVVVLAGATRRAVLSKPRGKA